ncbi:MAG: phospho-N-acetylmuramoyl-pentapeptide-transferase [Bacteroidales bacterium]|nr:phospho-N-acetylmuramoyl-pentapeptide-transferase [Bacteroidales bacterium]MBQ3439873.1 phospho-N-acetylmuramoyl-pentapeptide-transferase [Bacteroidales bacterium]MBR1793917.1 phospho-N-acetylmuramoyl-pentapeptide-transferase [Bacteroidales bacterium]
MIYHLFQYLENAGVDIPGMGLMHYLSFRAMMATVASVLFALLAGKRIIRQLQRHQIGETVRDLGLQGQIEKKGTPTMGGVIIILSVLVGVLLFCDLTNIYVILLLFSTLWCGALGFADDYIKVFKHNKEGLSEKAKLLGQVALGFIVALTVWLSPDIVVREKVSDPAIEVITDDSDRSVNTETQVTSGRYQEEDVVKSTKTTIPFVKNHEFDYRWLSPFKGAWGWYAKWAIYVLMIVLVITACSNGTNLTDGLDGLAAGTSAIVGVVLGILAWLGGNLIDSNYLNIMYIPGSGEIAIFMSAFVGALIGFLWYNSYPAQVFMGDTGSLTIGGIIGVTAVLIRKELLLPLLCGIFFVESLSVLLQRGYFKWTKKKYGEGRRIWSMTPLHHHFQDKKQVPGQVLIPKPVPPQHEAKITARFWIVGIILAVSTLALLKIR